MEPSEIRVNLQSGILEYEDGISTRGILPTASVLDFQAIGDGVVDDTLAFQRAVDAVPSSGGRIIVPRSPSRKPYYLTNQVMVRRGPTVIEVQEGAHIKKDSSVNVNAPFRFEGFKLGSTVNITVDPPAGATDITVADASTFSVGDWVQIKDDEPPATGSTGVHNEINRVRSKAGSVLSLYYPLADAYATVAAVDPTVQRIAPVLRSGVVGGGKIQNGDSPTVGNAGVDFSLCVGGYVKGVEFLEIQEDAVRYNDSMSGLITGCWMHDTTTFLSRGRGVSCRGSTHVILANNHVDRSRHSFDITFFSRYILVDHNTTRGCALAPLKAHPNCKHVWFMHNECDGNIGYDAGGSEWGTDTDAVGISIDQACSHIVAEGNQILNTNTDGVLVLTDATTHITIRGNKFRNWNTIVATANTAAITCTQVNTATSTVNLEGYIIEDNDIADGSGRGISFGMNGGIVRGNKVRNIRGPSGTMAGILIRSYDAGASVTPEEVFDVLVEGNTVIGCDGHGIQVGTSDADVTRCTVRDNYVRNCHWSGIQADPVFVNDITIDNNDVANVNDVGSGDADFAGIMHSTPSAVAGANEPGKAVITRNELRGIMRNGISCNATAAVIKGNITIGITSTSGGIGFGIIQREPNGTNGNTCDDQVFEENYCENCATDGMRIGAASGGATNNPRLFENTCRNNTGAGIRINETVTGARIKGAKRCEGNGTLDIDDNVPGNTRLLDHTEHLQHTGW